MFTGVALLSLHSQLDGYIRASYPETNSYHDDVMFQFTFEFMAMLYMHVATAVVFMG